MQKDNHVLRQRMVRETGSKTLPPPEVCVYQCITCPSLPPFTDHEPYHLSPTQIHITEVDDESIREE